MGDFIKFGDYVGGVRATSQTAAVLAARLEKAAPTDITTEEKNALRQVLATAREVHRVQSDRDRLAPAKLRPVLDDFVNDWSALADALVAHGRLSSSVSEEAPLAATLARSLFPDGVAFTQLPADRAWSEADRRLSRIETEELADDLERLIGAQFVEAVKQSTGRLANAIGTGPDAQPVASTTALAEALVKFGRAVGAYGRILAAHCDEEDDEAVARFLRAVAPIDQHRATMRPSHGRDHDEPEAEEPSSPGVTPPTPVIGPFPVLTPTPEPVS